MINHTSKSGKVKKCYGCGIPDDRVDKIKLLLSIFSNVNIHIMWRNPADDFQDLKIENH